MPKVFIRKMQTLQPKNKVHELIQIEFLKLHRSLHESKIMAVQAIKNAYDTALKSYIGRASAPQLNHFNSDKYSTIYHIDTCMMEIIEVNEEA